MAKNKTSTNDLFSNFKAPKIEKTVTDNEDSVLKTENSTNAEEKSNAPEKQPEETTSSTFDSQHNIDLMQYALPRAGRPKTLEGKYHYYTARIREDLFQYAQTRVGKGEEFQSVNDYINRLIAKDMLSNMNNNN
jgi:hypothetical protein